MSSLTEYFVDPVFRAPTIGAILMCFSAALVGVIAYVRQRSLVGEMLSHATYPGVILGGLIALPFSLLGALITALLGILCVHVLQKRRVSSDAALCAVLVGFLGVGVLLASRLQFSQPLLYQQLQTFLYGQPATMRDQDLVTYVVLASVSLLFVICLFQHLKIMNFDPDFAHVCGKAPRIVDTLTLLLLALAVVIGIRSVGLVLMSGMLVAPAIAARRMTHRFGPMFVIAGLLGGACGLAGTVLSVEISPQLRLPTGPMIVLLAALIALGSLFFAPEQGLLVRLVRRWRFQRSCVLENDLKRFWKTAPDTEISSDDWGGYLVWLRLAKLTRAGFCSWCGGKRFALTNDGRRRARHIVRLHRLWEVYLTSQLGICAGKVHRSAEEMEHILTPELERRLTQLLRNPTKDPHAQPIPLIEEWPT